MANIQLQYRNINDYMSGLMPFIQHQYEQQKTNEERLLTLASMEDLVNSAPPESNTYQEYQKTMQDLMDYSISLSKGNNLPGVNKTKALNIFRNYGKVTGKINRIQEQLKLSQTNRVNVTSQHPGGVIWQQNTVTDNIDDLANGKTVNDKFIDRKGALDIVQTQFANIGAALAKDMRYQSIKETEGYSVEAMQPGGIDALVIDDVWRTGTSNRVSKETVGVIQHYLGLAKQALGYDAFDKIGQGELEALIKTGATAAMSNPKYNVIDSGAKDRAMLGYHYAALNQSESHFNRREARMKAGKNKKKAKPESGNKPEGENISKPPAIKPTGGGGGDHGA